MQYRWVENFAADPNLPETGRYLLGTVVACLFERRSGQRCWMMINDHTQVAGWLISLVCGRLDRRFVLLDYCQRFRNCLISAGNRSA